MRLAPGAAAFLEIARAAAAGMGLVGGVLGFCVGLPVGLAAAYFLYLRYFAARRLQVTTRPRRPPPLPAALLSPPPRRVASLKSPRASVRSDCCISSNRLVAACWLIRRALRA